MCRRIVCGPSPASVPARRSPGPKSGPMTTRSKQHRPENLVTTGLRGIHESHAAGRLLPPNLHHFGEQRRLCCSGKMSMASRSTGFDERPERRVWRRRLCACDRSDGRSTRPLPLRRPNHLDPTSSSTPAARSPLACATPDLQRKRSSSMDLAGGNHFLHCFRCQDPCWDGKAHS